MSDVIERAEAALEGVTEGPWRTEKSKYVSGWYIISPENSTLVHATEWAYGNFKPPADYQFVCDARTLVPELIAEVKRLRWHVRHGDSDHMCDECWPADGDEKPCSDCTCIGFHADGCRLT